MGFPFEFTKSSGSYDFISPAVNFTGNAAVIAVGGITLGLIASIALKALGFSALATTIATAIPVSIGVISAVGAVVGLGFLIAMAIAVSKALGRR